MVKIQPCRNGCKKLITVQLDDGKYKPFEVDTEGNTTQLHNCPNSEYNKNKQQQGGQTPSSPQQQFTPRLPTQPIDKPSLDQVLLNQISQKLELLKQQMETAISEKLEGCYQLAKSNNDMLGEFAKALHLTDPKKASELYEVMQHTKQEALKGEVHGWNSVPDNSLATPDEESDKELEEKGI